MSTRLIDLRTGRAICLGAQLGFEEGFEEAIGLLEFLGAVPSKEDIDSLPQDGRVRLVSIKFEENPWSYVHDLGKFEDQFERGSSLSTLDASQMLCFDSNLVRNFFLAKAE